MGVYGMGPGMMTGGFANRPVGPDWGGPVLAPAQVQDYLRDRAGQGRVDAKADTVTYGGTEVTIDMVAVQPGHHDQTYVVAGLTDPTLIVPRGATVHLTLVNMDYGDNMEHGLILTPAPPPYPSMSMMYTGPGIVRMAALPWRRHVTRCCRRPSSPAIPAPTGTSARRRSMPSKACTAGSSCAETPRRLRHRSYRAMSANGLCCWSAEEPLSNGK